MTLRVNYIGDSNFRVVTRSDMIARGLTDPGQDMVWSKANSYELDVPNDVGALLLSSPGDFATDEDLNFGEVLADAFGGRLLGVAELDWNLTTTALNSTPAVAPGLQVEVEATGRPLRVALDLQTLNSVTGNGVQVALYEGANVINFGLAFTGSGGGLVLAPWSLINVRIPVPGLVVYSVRFGKFTTGIATLAGSAISPVTLSVTEL